MSTSILPPDSGLSSEATTLVGSVFKLARVRISLAAMEFSDARDSFFRLLLLSMVSLIVLIFSLLSFSAMIVALVWDTLGWYIFFIFSVFYLLLAISILWKAHGIIVSGRIGLPLTLAELRKDRAAIFGEHGNPDRAP
jgi:uncharacterized membrane protein YqjE